MRAFAALLIFMTLSYLSILISSQTIHQPSDPPPSDSISTRAVQPALWSRPPSPVSILISVFPSEYAVDLARVLIEAWHVIHERILLVGIDSIESVFNWLGNNNLILRIQNIEGEDLTLMILQDALEDLYDFFVKNKLGGMLATFDILDAGKKIAQGSIGVL